MAGRIDEIDSLLDGVTTYAHDNRGQLMGADHSSAPDEAYVYDENGNRDMAGHTVNPNNRLATDGVYNYTYDDEGNRILKVEIATGLRTEYGWDHRNRLTNITEKNSSGTTVLSTVTQSYDVFNRWVRTQVDSNGPVADGQSERFFVYDGTQIVMEFDGADDSDLTHRYLWGPAVDQILADEQTSSLGSAGSVVWPLTDHLGTARNLATYDAGTDITTRANHRKYDSFGNLVSENNSAVDHLFGFTGRPWDDASNLQYNLNRWYDSVTGQWMSEDPIGFAAGDGNLNRYVKNGAILASDPTGLYEEWTINVFVGHNNWVIEQAKKSASTGDAPKGVN